MRRVGAVAALIAMLLLTGCSSLAFFYNRAPALAYWQLDSHIDLDKAQAPGARAAIKAWFTWHRAEELPRYAALLSSLRAEVTGPVSAARICAINDELRATFRRSILTSFGHFTRTSVPGAWTNTTSDTANAAANGRRSAT